MITLWTAGLVSNIYKGSFANLAAKEYLSSRAVGLDLNGRDRSGGERESMAAGIGPAARHPRRCHGKAHRSSRFLAYRARFDSPVTWGEREEGVGNSPELREASGEQWRQCDARRDDDGSQASGGADVGQGRLWLLSKMR